jgi:hypothetical protein
MTRYRFLFSAFLISLVSFSSCSKTEVVQTPGSLDYKSLGSAATNILSGVTYTSMKIEIQYMPGYQPDASVLSNYISFFNTYINKPAGVSIIQQQIPASGKTTLTVEDIAAIEKSNRTVFTTGNQIGLHILIVDADYSSPDIAGISYWNTSLCLFGKLIYNHSGGIGQVTRTKLETTVLEHESGHIIGLVDQGSPMQVNHKDPANGNHCNNPACLMYYAIEIADVGGSGSTTPIATFDANCVADLKANGGK